MPYFQTMMQGTPNSDMLHRLPLDSSDSHRPDFMDAGFGHGASSKCEVTASVRLDIVECSSGPTDLNITFVT